MQWGCSGPSPYPVAELDGEAIYECPLRPYCSNPAAWTPALRAYAWMRRGFLPDEGTWLDQTEVFIEVCNVLEAANGAAQRERAQNTGAD